MGVAGINYRRGDTRLICIANYPVSVQHRLPDTTADVVCPIRRTPRHNSDVGLREAIQSIPRINSEMLFLYI